MQFHNRTLFIVMAAALALMIATHFNDALTPTPSIADAQWATAGGVMAAGAQVPTDANPSTGQPQPPRSDDLDRLERMLLTEKIEDARQARIDKLVKTGLGGLFSSIILVSALVVIFRRASSTDEKNWAFGAIGAILGFWIGR